MLRIPGARSHGEIEYTADKSACYIYKVRLRRLSSLWAVREGGLCKISLRFQPPGVLCQEAIKLRGPFTQLYVHCVWATWDRLPLITPDYEAQIYASIAAKCRELGCEPLEIGGIEDHMHLLVQIPPTVAVSMLIKEVKGLSSHLMTHVLQPGVFFRWQGAYGAFSVSHDAMPHVVEYIRNQKTHHSEQRLLAEWERWEEKDATQTSHGG